MKIFLTPSTVGRYGGGLNGNLRYLDNLIENELTQLSFESSFEELLLTLCYPPMYILPGIVGMEIDFNKRYEKLPYSRIDRRYKIDISLQSPEFSEHFDLAEQVKYQHKFEIEQKFRNISEVDLAKHLIAKFFEVLAIIKPKLKKSDVFDCTKFEHALNSILQKITPELLAENASYQTKKIQLLQVETSEGKRLERKNKALPKDKLIRVIRLYYTYKLPKSLFYLNRLTETTLRALIKKEFYCPQYHHLYISVANTRDEALKRALIAEDWFTYGIAVLKEETLLQASELERESLVLNVIKEGLLDIAELDGLDKNKILNAVNEARLIGALSETNVKFKENNKIVFIISTKGILGKIEEEVFFTIIDKTTKRAAKWKFGEENSHLIGNWFRTISVSNRSIKTKPSANMGLVLKDKQMYFDFDIEKELADPSKTIQNSQQVTDLLAKLIE